MRLVALANGTRLDKYPEPGDTYDKWTVLNVHCVAESLSAQKFVCRCLCGREQLVSGRSLAIGKSTQCFSCRAGGKRAPKRDSTRARFAHLPLWLYKKLVGHVRGAIYRCTNPAAAAYVYYGGRGIDVCTAWMLDEGAGVEYLLTLPGHDNADLYIDRIDNDGNYEPNNIRFVTVAESNRNKRQNNGR